MDLLDGVIQAWADALGFAIDLINSTLSTVWGWASTALQWVEGAWNTVSGWIWDAVSGFYRDVIQPAIGLVDSAWRYAWGGLDYFAHSLENAFDWVRDNFVMPAWNWIVHAAETVGGWIANAISAFYHDFILPIWNSLNSAWDWIFHWADYIATRMYDAVELIYRAWDWIFWFAVHSFEDLLNYLGGGADSLNKQWVLQTAHGADEWAGRIVDDLERLLR